MAFNKQTLLAAFEIKGQWWLPGQDIWKASGVLNFSPETGIRLEIIGSLSSDQVNSRPMQGHYIVHGIGNNGQICTIIENVNIGHTSLSTTGVVSEIYHSRYLFIGKHISTFEDLSAAIVSVNFTGLDEWLGWSPFSSGHQQLENDVRESVTYRFPEPIVVDVPSRHLTVRFVSCFSSNQTLHRSVTLEHEVFIQIVPAQPETFRDLWELILGIRNFLTLMLVQPTFVRKLAIKLTLDDGSPELRVFYGQGIHRTPEFYGGDLLLEYEKIASNFREIFVKWIEEIERFDPVQDLLFGFIDKPDIYANFGFLSLMQAIESFHRLTMDGKYVEESNYLSFYNQIVSGFPANLPSDLREALKARVKFGNEYSLRKRLRNLFDSIDLQLRHLVDRDYEKFITQIVDDRNYLTHYDQQSMPRGYDRNRLRFATYKLRKLLTILLLLHLGINSDLIHEAVIKNRLLWPWR